jgi:hypothetical protein
MTALLLIAGLLLFAMAVTGVWLMRHAEAEPAARAVGRAPDPAEEEEARQTLSTPRPRSGMGEAQQRPSGGALRE